MKKITHLFARMQNISPKSRPVVGILGSISLVLVIVFFTTRGTLPNMSELSFVEKSTLGESAGSVIPASCDSNGVSTYDHPIFTWAWFTTPGRTNDDGTYDIKPCPPTSCPAWQGTFTRFEKWYCDYTDYNQPGAVGVPAPGQRPPQTWVDGDGNYTTFDGSCPSLYSRSDLFSGPIDCSQITFRANPDGMGECIYTVRAAVLRTVIVNSCSDVDLNFQ